MRLASATMTLMLLAATASAEPMLRGRVMSWDGRPGAGIRVDVVDVAPDFEISPLPGAKFLDRALASATAGADGTFAIDAARMPEGLLSLALVPPSGAPLLLDGERIAFGPAALPQDLALVVPPLVACDGVVLDPSGAPAASVRIGVAVGGPLADTVMTIVTDAHGVFRIDGLPAPGLLRLVARKGDDAIALGAVRLPLSGSVRQALHLEPMIDASGTLLAAGGEKPTPLAGVRVVATAPLTPEDAAAYPVGDSWDAFVARTITDPTGRYALRVPRRSILRPWEPTLPTTRLVPGTTVLARVTPLGGRVIGGGKPVAGAAIRIAGELETRSDDHGAFAVPPIGTSWLAVAPWGEVARDSSSDSRGPVLRLAGSHRLSGLLIEPPREGEDEPRPVAGATVRIALRGQRQVASATDAGGHFALNVPGRVSSITACASGRCSVASEPTLDATQPVTLTLGVSSAIAGRVTSTGRDLVGALILASPVDVAGPEVAASTTTSGAFMLGGLPQGSWSVVALADGRLPKVTERVAVRTLDGVPPSAEPFTLDLSGRVRVRCLDAEGHPVANARVSEEARIGRESSVRGIDANSDVAATAGSGPDGIALLDGLVAGECAVVRARKPGFASAREDCLTATPVGAAVDLVLAAPASLAGSVHDAAGAPIAGATVAAVADPTTAQAKSSPGSFARDPSELTDVEGAWELRDLTAGRLEIVASAPGFAPGEPMPIDLASGQRIDGLAIVLDPGATVEGDVVSALGLPVEGARVTASVTSTGVAARARNWWSPGTDTGSDGRFALGGLPREVEIELEASKDGARSEPRVVTPGSDAVRLVMRASGVIEGKLLGAESLMVAPWILCRGAPRGDSSALAEGDGAFRVGGVEAGTYTCVAVAGEEAEGRAEGIAVRAGETATTTITLGPRRMIDVAVREHPSGEPISGADVRLYDVQRKTDADGHARVALPPFAQRSEINVFMVGYEDARRSVPTPAPATIDIKLARACLLRGRVVDAEDKPAAGARVATNSVFRGDPVGAEGTFEIASNGTTGHLTLSATREREGLIEKGTLDVDVPPEGLEGLVIRLDPVATGSVLVSVVDGEAPAIRANVKLVHESMPGRKDVLDATMGGWREGGGAIGVTDEEGTFVGEGLLPGEIAILAGRETETTVRRVGTVTLAPGGHVDATVRLVGGWSVTGRVVREGEGVEGAQVTASEGTGPDPGRRRQLAAAMSGPAGAFTLGPLPDAIPLVRIEAWSNAQPGDGRASIDATPGSRDISLDIAGVGITGRVIADGAPAADVEVGAAPLDGSRGVPGRTGPDGAFVLRGCSRNTPYSVSARQEGRAPAAVTVTTPAAGSVDAGTLDLKGEELVGTARAAAGDLGLQFSLRLLQPDGSRLDTIQVDVEPDGAWHARAPATIPLAFRAWTPRHEPILGMTTPGTPLVLVFQRGAELEMTVERVGGVPAVGATAQLVSWNGRDPDEYLIPSRLPAPDGSRVGASADARGVLLSGPLAAGDCVLEVSRYDCQPRRVSVTLAEGERKSLSVTLEPR